MLLVDEQFERSQDRDSRWAESALPSIFCWTKMGAEAGQSLTDILRRKDMERQAGNGTFTWGIGNSLGSATTEARKAAPNGLIDVLFTPMKSPAKSADQNPDSILLWTSYLTESNQIESLPMHSIVTSRGGKSKRAHYALICRREKSILEGEETGVLDAAQARNFRSLNPVGASQVTAIVKYDGAQPGISKKPYNISFRATLHGEGFVRLAAPVLLEGELLSIYREACALSTLSAWKSHTLALREAASKRLCKKAGYQADLFA